MRDLDITQDWDENFEVAMFMAKEYRRKGYMLESLKGFIKCMPKGRSLKFCIDRKNKSSLIATQKLERIVEKTAFCPKNLRKEFRFFILEI